METKDRDIPEDEDPMTLSKEELGGTGKSEWCVFCGNTSTNYRKRKNCNIHESQKLIKVPKVLRKIQKRLQIKYMETRRFNHLECT